MSYYTRQYPTFKEAVQGAMVYSPDLTAAVAQVQTDMGADWDDLTGDDWQTDFLPRFMAYTLDTAGTQFWGIETDQNTVRFTKREKSFVTFEFLSTTYVEAKLLELDLAGWTRHQ